MPLKIGIFFPHKDVSNFKKALDKNKTSSVPDFDVWRSVCPKSRGALPLIPYECVSDFELTR